MCVIDVIKDDSSAVFSVIIRGSSQLHVLCVCRVWLQFLSVRSTVQNMAKSLTNTSDSVS